MTNFEKELVKHFEINNWKTAYVVVYKVVDFGKRKGEKMKSWLVNLIPKSLILSYKLNEKTVPKVGCIFAFKDHESAFVAADIGRDFILKCYAMIEYKNKMIRISAMYIEKSKDIKYFWDNYNEPFTCEQLRYVENCEPEVVYCSELTPYAIIDE